VRADLVTFWVEDPQPPCVFLAKGRWWEDEPSSSCRTATRSPRRCRRGPPGWRWSRSYRRRRGGPQPRQSLVSRPANRRSRVIAEGTVLEIMIEMAAEDVTVPGLGRTTKGCGACLCHAGSGP